MNSVHKHVIEQNLSFKGFANSRPHLHVRATSHFYSAFKGSATTLPSWPYHYIFSKTQKHSYLIKHRQQETEEKSKVQTAWGPSQIFLQLPVPSLPQVTQRLSIRPLAPCSQLAPPAQPMLTLLGAAIPTAMPQCVVFSVLLKTYYHTALQPVLRST